MKYVLLCLHGWGGSKESFAELRAILEGENVEILTPDLPGFGAEPEPKEPWNVHDYADWVEEWFQETLRPTPYALRPLHLLGHSHGGRIALVLAARKTLPVEHLFLCAAAGIRRPSLKRALGQALALGGKKILSLPLIDKLQPTARSVLYKVLRTHDYERASPVMQQTLVKVVEEDLTPLLKEITVPTDLFWGEKDTMTPLRDGRIMHSAIPGSVLHTFAGTGHRVHRDRALEIAEVIRSHLPAA
ncbi:MAG: alpha/beta hydrolase [Candidatus Peribacteraceae bacterium]|nr:alpha/beta hydrolase [Candidatus Peribacteraceae bacterium]